MASVTLAESAKLCQDELVSGVIENVVTVNKAFQVMPFDGIEGNALAYNRENVLGDVQVAGVNGAVTAKAAATFTLVTSALTTIIGDAEVNGLIQATRSNPNDQAAIQISSKAKSTGRQYQDMFINGTGASDEFDGLINLCAAGQTRTAATDGEVFDFPILDELMDLVVSKDGQVDFFQMPARTVRAYFAKLRALGGAGIGETMSLPDGSTVPMYRSVPIFRNDWIPVDQTQGVTTTCTTIFAGCWDDGSRTNGVAGLTAENAAGINVVDVGEAEDSDDHIWRVKWYCGLALFSEKALAMAPGITN